MENICRVKTSRDISWKKIELGKLLSTCPVDSKDNTDVYSIRPERLNNGVASNRIAGELKNEM